MTATVQYHRADEPIIGKLSDDFKYIILPDDFMSPYISGFGKVKVEKLKLNKHLQDDAKDYNGIALQVKPILVNNNAQVVKMNTSIIDYFKMIMGFQNENQEYRDITEKEFKYELTKALNCGIGNKEIVWVDDK
jgi:hypothetical protein